MIVVCPQSSFLRLVPASPDHHGPALGRTSRRRSDVALGALGFDEEVLVGDEDVRVSDVDVATSYLVIWLLPGFGELIPDLGQSPRR